MVAIAVLVLVTPAPILPLFFWSGSIEVPVLPVPLLQVLVPSTVLAIVPIVIVSGVAVIIPVIAVVGCRGNRCRGDPGESENDCKHGTSHEKFLLTLYLQLEDRKATCALYRSLG